VPPVKDIGEREILTVGDIEALIGDVFLRIGLTADAAAAMARSVSAAETAGLRRVGLGLMPQIVEHLRCGRVCIDAAPRLSETAPAGLTVDADGGFACPALELGLQALCNRAQAQGIAVLSVTNAYPVGSALPFLDHCAGQDLIGIASVAGLMTRAAPNGDLVQEIEPRSFGPLSSPAAVPAALLPVVPDTSSATATSLTPFEGPLGPPFRLHHRFIALRRDLWHPDSPPQPRPPAFVQNSGIAVPVSLLEKIINA